MVPKSSITNFRDQRVRSKCCGSNHTADSSPKSKQIDNRGAALPRGRGVAQVTSSPHHSRNQELGSCAIPGMRILATPHNQAHPHNQKMPPPGETVADLRGGMWPSHLTVPVSMGHKGQSFVNCKVSLFKKVGVMLTDANQIRFEYINGM